MDASSALHLLDDMDFSTVTAAPVGGWPSSSSSSTSDNDKVNGRTNNDTAPTTGLDDLYLQVQKHSYSNERSPSKQLEIARVVSNDDGDDSDEGSDHDDEIPDLTITQTKSFDEEENIINGTGARPLPVICEQDQDDAIGGREENDDDGSMNASFIGDIVEKSPLVLNGQSTAQSSNDHSECIRSILYDEVRKTTERCVEMQKKLNDKDTELKELDESKQLIIKHYREARDHHRTMKRRFESIYEKMIANHRREHFQFHAAIEERDRKIHERNAVIQQLKDANEKLEVALKAMTKVAEDALKAKWQVRQELKSKHLKDIQKMTTKHEEMTTKHEAAIKELKSSISSKVSALHELESTKAQLVDQLQAREKELKLEIKMRMERSAASYDVDSAKKLLMEGAARNNINASARAMKREQKKRVAKQLPKQLPPSPREIQVRNECHWLHEQITTTIQKIVNAKSDIEKMEFSFNNVLNEKGSVTAKPTGILARADRKPLRVRTDN